MGRKNPLDLYWIDEELCAGCLACQLRCSFLFHREFNPSKSRITVEPVGDVAGRGNRVSFTEECTACGVCVKYCGYGALGRKGEQAVTSTGG